MWIFISRIKRTIENEEISEYLAKKLNRDKTEFVIKEVPTKSTQNKCFMIGANFRFKDKMYEPSFWPSGVAFRRFDFNLYRRVMNMESTQNFQA